MASESLLRRGHASEVVVLVPPSGAAVGDDGKESEGRAVVVKRLLPSADADDVARLGNELRILTRIQEKIRDATTGAEEASRIRRVLGRDENNGGGPVVRSIRLEYERGISLREYVASRNRPSESAGDDDPDAAARRDMLERTRIAHGVCAALDEVHRHGVVHNAVTTSSFVVDGAAGTVKIISFGDAIRSDHLEATDDGERVNDDLPALGRVLLALFCVAPDDGEEEEEEEGAVGYGFGFGASLQTPRRAMLPRVPASVRVLLRNLHDAHNTTDPGNVPDAYFSVRDVAADAAQLVGDPSVFLFDDDDDRGTIRFQRGSERRTYGREKEASVLRDVCDRFLSGLRQDAAAGALAELSSVQQSLAASISSMSAGFVRSKGHTELVIVSGTGGSGRTHLVRHVVSDWLDDGASCDERDGRSDDGTATAAIDRGYLIEGYFYEQQSGRPYSAIFQAIAHFAEQVVRRGPEATAAVAADIREAAGPLGGVLVESIPELESIIGPQASPHGGVSGLEAKNRFRLAFQKLFQAISKPDCPVVLFLKNIQWADGASLSLLQTIIASANSLIVGSANRNADVAGGLDDPLSLLLAKAKRVIPLTNIALEGIDGEAVAALLSDATGTYRRQLAPLADLLLLKTSGHALAVTQTARALVNDGALYYDADGLRWRWDDARIREREVPDDVVHVFAARIESLPGDARDVLQVAAVFGTRFDVVTLRAVMGEMKRDEGDGVSSRRSVTAKRVSLLSQDSLFEILRTLEEEGIVAPVGPSGFKFVHVAIQRAAYNLLALADREVLHVHAGNVLRTIAEDGGSMDRDIFLVCGHLNKGRSRIESQEDRARLASLNLRAGEKAVKTSAFEGAAACLEQGLDLMSENGVTFNHTSLRLHCLRGAAELVNRNFDAVKASVDWVLASPATVLEKFPSYMSLVKYLVAQGTIDEAISTGFNVLAQLGESMPKSAGMPVILREVVKTKMKLSGKKDSDIRALPPMKDPSKLAAMQMLALMISLCYVTQPEMVGPVTFRMVRLTLRYGLCSESSFGFGSYAMILSGIMGDAKGGYRFGRLALDLLERLDARTWLARVYGLVYYFVAYWQEPATDALDKFLHAFKVAMEVGDHEYAAWQFVNYSGTALQTGQHLDALQAAMFDSNAVCDDIQQIFPQSILVLWWQCVLNLLGESDNPLILAGTAVPDEEKYLEDATAANNTLGLHTLYFLRMMLAYTFCDFELALEYGDKGRGVIAKLAPGQLIVVSHAYYDGLVACALLRNLDKNTDRKKLLNIASSAKRRMKKWASISPDNFKHKHSLLKAECAALKGNHIKASASYEDAIAAAKKNGFIQDEAIANERLATYLSTSSEKEKAEKHEAKAQQLFEEWGAIAKVEHMDRNR